MANETQLQRWLVCGFCKKPLPKGTTDLNPCHPETRVMFSTKQCVHCDEGATTRDPDGELACINHREGVKGRREGRV